MNDEKTISMLVNLVIFIGAYSLLNCNEVTSSMETLFIFWDSCCLMLIDRRNNIGSPASEGDA